MKPGTNLGAPSATCQKSLSNHCMMKIMAGNIPKQNKKDHIITGMPANHESMLE